jgi:hypothetical protein
VIKALPHVIALPLPHSLPSVLQASWLIICGIWRYGVIKHYGTFRTTPLLTFMPCVAQWMPFRTFCLPPILWRWSITGSDRS